MSPQHAAMVGMYQTANATTSKAKQVVMLYEGMIKFVQQAKGANEKQDIEIRYNTTQKAMDIIVGLQAAIDFDHGGDIAHVLQSFYNDMFRELSDLQRGADATRFDAVVKEMRAMLDAWKEVASQETAPAAVAVQQPSYAPSAMPESSLGAPIQA